uniref:Uncharacterized protein n=1 Tax=Nelumbo nucifera TaxID=4432 RepID=A0A822YY67_NELNU|nr:TPA_asm: hypothetical protein HUJ06_007794 [Nelumbo nucifera]
MIYDWHAKCIEGCHLVQQAPENIYLNLLFLILENWCCRFACRTLASLPILKYVNQYNNVLLSFNSAQTTKQRNFLSDDEHHAWVNKWNMELGCSKMFLLPNSIQMALRKFPRRDTMISWLYHIARIQEITLFDFARPIFTYLFVRNLLLN